MNQISSLGGTLVGTSMASTYSSCTEGTEFGDVCAPTAPPAGEAQPPAAAAAG